MVRFKLIIIVVFYFTGIQVAHAADCRLFQRAGVFMTAEIAQSTNGIHFYNLTRELVQLAYPKLMTVPVVIQGFDSDDSFFQAQPACFFSGQRIYTLQVNRKLFAGPFLENAFRATLLHEFSHLNDYIEMTNLEIANLGLTFQLTPTSPSVVAYERATDLMALSKGAGYGLNEYRNWLYPRVSLADAEIKKRLYLTPDEITSVLNAPQKPDLGESNHRLIRRLFNFDFDHQKLK